MDRNTIYIDKTGISNVDKTPAPQTPATEPAAYTDANTADTVNIPPADNHGDFQFTSGPNPGQFVMSSTDDVPKTEPTINFDFEATASKYYEHKKTDTAEPFTLDDLAADSSQHASGSPGFDRIDFAGSYRVNGSGGDPTRNAGFSSGFGSGGEPPNGNGNSGSGGEPPYGNGGNGNGGNGNGGNGNDGQPPAGGKRRRKKVESKPVNLTRSSLAAIIIICVFLSSAFGFGGAMLASNMITPAGNTGTINTSNADTKGFDLEDATGSEMTVQEITEETLDSVVEIRTESVQMDSWMGQYVTEGAGSGVIIKENGYIVTNNHVVEGASNIIVTTTDQKEYEATLIGTDADTDVAVIKINAKGLKAATMGNSDQLNVGDLAVAIGNPLGELGGTVTAGIISALDRSISIDGKTMTLLQTDTSINPGNSGGGLFNQYGQLIGVVVAKSSGSDVEGLGFAIPINRAAEVASQLMDGGYVKGKPSTGMAYQDMSQQQQQSSDMFGFGFDEFFGSGSMQQSGVYIAEINGKNAKKAGFEIGDMVYSVDGQEIDSFDTLSSIITSHKVGDTVTYIVLRDGQALEIDLVLEEKTE